MAWGMIKRWQSSRQWIPPATSTDATLRWTPLSWRALGARSKTPANLHNQGEYRRIPAATARKMHSEDQTCSRANQPKWPHHRWRTATISGASEAPTTKTNRNKTRNRKKSGFSDSVTLDKAKLEREELKEKQKRTLKRKHKKISQSKHNHTDAPRWWNTDDYAMEKAEEVQRWRKRKVEVAGGIWIRRWLRVMKGGDRCSIKDDGEKYWMEKATPGGKGESSESNGYGGKLLERESLV